MWAWLLGWLLLGCDGAEDSEVAEEARSTRPLILRLRNSYFLGDPDPTERAICTTDLRFEDTPRALRDWDTKRVRPAADVLWQWQGWGESRWQYTSLYLKGPESGGSVEFATLPDGCYFQLGDCGADHVVLQSCLHFPAPCAAGPSMGAWTEPFTGAAVTETRGPALRQATTRWPDGDTTTVAVYVSGGAPTALTVEGRAVQTRVKGEDAAWYGTGRYTEHVEMSEPVRFSCRKAD